MSSRCVRKLVPVPSTIYEVDDHRRNIPFPSIRNNANQWIGATCEYKESFDGGNKRIIFI